MAGAPTSYGYPGSVNASILSDWLTRAAAARFSVGGPDDWKVTAQPGMDRGIRINAGTGVGDSVMDVFPDYDTRSLPAVASGSQWFLIVARRNWSTPASTKFFVIPGSSERKLPVRKDTPGQESDQPIALVRCTAGQTVVTEVVDLRGWAGNGGVEVADIMGRDQLARPGAAVKVGPVVYRYEMKDNGVWGWSVPKPPVRRAQFYAKQEWKAGPGWGPGILERDVVGSTDPSIYSPSRDLVRLPEAGLYDLMIWCFVNKEITGPTYLRLLNESETLELASADFTPWYRTTTLAFPGFYAPTPMTIRLRANTVQEGLTLWTNFHVTMRN